jgi:hypothetical protein
MLRGPTSIFKPFTDDRGRPIRIADRVTLGKQAALEKADWKMLSDSLHVPSNPAALLPIVGVIAVMILIQAFNPPWWAWLPLGMVFGTLWVRIWSKLSVLPMCFTRGRAFVHQLVRAGVCPRCCYCLDGLEPDGDGLLDCPECGAAWREERRSGQLAPGDQSRRWAIRRKFRAVLRFSIPAPRFDHRDRETNLRLYRPRGFQRSDYGNRCLLIDVVLRRRASWARLLLSLGLCGVGLGLFFFVLFFPWIQPTPVWAYGALVVIAVSLFAAFLVRSSDVAIRPASIEAETLSRGICPSCWELIHYIQPGDDGCTMCPDCGSSWRVPPPTKSTPMSCPACRYSFVGLEQETPGVVRCPECGEVCIGKIVEAE